MAKIKQAPQTSSSDYGSFTRSRTVYPRTNDWDNKKVGLSRGEKGGILKFVLLLLICCVLIGQLSGSNNEQSFGSLLQFISNCPQLGTTYINFTELQLTDWGFYIGNWFVSFNWLRDVVWKPFLGFYNILEFIMRGLLNLIGYIGYFIKFFFTTA